MGVNAWSTGRADPTFHRYWVGPTMGQHYSRCLGMLFSRELNETASLHSSRQTLPAKQVGPSAREETEQPGTSGGGCWLRGGGPRSLPGGQVPCRLPAASHSQDGWLCMDRALVSVRVGLWELIPCPHARLQILPAVTCLRGMAFLSPPLCHVAYHW